MKTIGQCPKCGFDFENPPDDYKSAYPNWDAMREIHPEAVVVVCTCCHEIPVGHFLPDRPGLV